MLKLNCDAHVLRVWHKTRKSDDSIMKMFVSLMIENVHPGQGAWIYGLEVGSGEEVVKHLSDGPSQRFPNVARSEILSHFKVGSAQIVFGNLKKQRGEVTEFAIKPQGMGLSTIWCKVAIEQPGSGYYESMTDFEGRSMHVRIEQDEELNVTTKQKAKQAAMDLPAGSVKDAVKGARKKRGGKDASKKPGRVRTAQADQSASAS